MKKKQITVKKGSFVWLKGGNYKIRCEMTDDSIWECDKEYKDWKCVKPSDELLSEYFQNFINNK